MHGRRLLVFAEQWGGSDTRPPTFSRRRAAGSDSGGGGGTWGGAGGTAAAATTPGGKVLRGDEVAAEASPWQAETLGRKGDAFFRQHDNGAGGSDAATSELARTPCSDELQGGGGGRGRGDGRPAISKLIDQAYIGQCCYDSTLSRPVSALRMKAS